MKTSVIKLKSKAYMIGNTSVLCLLFFTLFASFICLNLLPEIAIQTLPEVHRNVLLICVSMGIVFLSFVIFSLSDMGFVRFFLRKAEKNGGSVTDLFYYFTPKKAVKLFVFSVKFSTVKTFLFLICFLPFIGNNVFFFNLTEHSVSLKVSAVMLVSAVMFFFSGLYFYLTFCDSFFLVKYNYAKGEYFSFSQLLSSSQEQMKNNRKALMKLRFSFILWMLISLLFFPSAYVFSYYSQCKAVLAAEIMTD